MHPRSPEISEFREAGPCPGQVPVCHLLLVFVGVIKARLNLLKLAVITLSHDSLHHLSRNHLTNSIRTVPYDKKGDT